MVDRFLPGNRYTLELGGQLKESCELYVFCQRNASASEEGITWLPWFYPGGKNKAEAVWEYGISLLRLAETIRRERFDVVHIQTFKDIRYEAPLYIGLKKYCKKLVLTVHNVLPHEEDRRKRSRYKKMYDCCDELIVHNETSAKCLADEFYIPKNKITVIAHGTYQAQPKSENDEKKDGKKHFLLIGFIRRYKGIDILLEAIAKIPKAEREKLYFIIAGKQYAKLDDTDYEGMINTLGIGNCVSFINGFVPEKRLGELMWEADFLVFPYRHIYGSGALLLAYTYGKPVIASDIPAFLEETDNGRTGILFKSENPQALAEALKRAAGYRTEEVGLFRSEIQRLVEEKYNWKISAARTVEVYQK